MGKSSKAPASQTVTQQNIPKEFMPYFSRLMGRVEEQSLQPYQPFEGARLAPSDQFGDIGASQGMVRDLTAAGTPMLDEAAGMSRAAGQGALGLASLGPSQFSQFGGFQAGQAAPFAGFQAGQAAPFSDFSQAGYNAFQYDPAGEFSGEAVGRYMDPYMQNVVDIQKRQAQEDYDIARGSRSARAVQAGAFGGSRAAVQEGLAERDMLDRQAEIQARGLSTAYGDAQRMFGEDRSARMAQQQAQAGEFGRVQSGVAGEMARVQQARAAELARTQGISIEEAARVQQQQAAELARTQGISIDEASRIQAAQAAELSRVQSSQAAEDLARQRFGLDALSFYSGQGQQLAGLSEQQRAAEIQNAQLLEAVGRAQQGEAQAGLDIGYQDFLRQQGYPQEQLAFYSDILRGLPVAPTTAQTQQSNQFYNPYSQLLGAGLSGLSLYRAFQG